MACWEAPSTYWSSNSVSSHKYRHFAGSLPRMKHERFYRGVFTALSMLFLSPDLSSGELRTTYCCPDLGHRNRKYNIIISSRGFHWHYFDCWVTRKTSLGSPFTRHACMLDASTGFLFRCMYFLFNPLHNIPSGILSAYCLIESCDIKAKSAAVWSAWASRRATRDHTLLDCICYLLIPDQEINNGAR